MPVPEFVLTLGEADLDVVELVLAGAIGEVAIPPAALPDDFAGSVVLSDVEATPIARFVPTVREDGALHGALTPLQPRAHRVGAAWDPAVRRRAAEVRESLAGRRTTAVVFRDAPSADDLALAAQSAADAEAVLWVALASSARRRDRLGGDALVQAVMAQRPDSAIGLVVPAGDPPEMLVADLAPETILTSYGADAVVDVTGHRRGVQVYPPESRAVLERLERRRGLHRPGMMVLFTGLSGSGKSTIAKAVASRLEFETWRSIALLDGDEVRLMLSSELGFDRRSRDLNVRRIGYVGALVAEAGGIAIAAPIAPFDEVRKEVRAQVERSGASFVLVHISTPLEVCEARDRKGLYAKARAGLIPEFTGISSPYEEPTDAEVTIDASAVDLAAAADAVIAALRPL